MCGILGVRKSWLPRRQPVAAALQAMAWRGPDGSVLLEVGDWFLGVARLAISDPDADQPIQCSRTGRWVLLNGAATSAAAEWSRHSGRARTRNDAELALLRLEAGGPRELSATHGPFALAVVDPQRDELFLARDPEGEKPLFVLERAGRVVAFASSVASLRSLGADVVLSPTEQARLLRYGFPLGPTCTDPVLRDLRGVHEDRPGTGLQALAEEPSGTHSQEPGSPLRSVIQAAVERCAAAEVPVALSLSGGVDSSCLAAALRAANMPLPAYQFQAGETDPEERNHARTVAAHTGLELRPVGGGAEILQALAELTRHTGLPMGDPSVFAAHALARVASADGVRVLLSGEGADELWLGYRRHRAAAWLPSRGLWPRLRGGLGTGTRARLMRALFSATPYDGLLQVAPAAFLARVLEPGALPPGDLPGAGNGQPCLDRARNVDRQYYLRWDLLPKLDTATMAAGIEGRCPYLDPEVLAAADGREVGGRQILNKRPLKRAFEAELPGPILHQRKRGFGLPLDRWLREDDYLSDLLLEQRTLERGALRRDGLRRMLDLHRRREANLGHPLYLVAALETYWRYLESAA